MGLWMELQHDGLELAGYIPGWLDENDPRPAREQLDAAYGHGGGWRPMQGWKLDGKMMRISYPGDPPLRPVAMGSLRDERIFVYRHAWVMILQADGTTFEIARMD